MATSSVDKSFLLLFIVPIRFFRSDVVFPLPSFQFFFHQLLDTSLCTNIKNIVYGNMSRRVVELEISSN